jgi:hypothetical protein
MECRSSTDLDTKHLAATMITERQLIEIVKYALRHYNFREYQRLKADGSLDLLAQLRAEAALETRDYLMSLARDEALNSDLDSMNRVSRQMRKNREANAIAIAQATEFEPNTADAEEKRPEIW